jgi:hypothetical protein
MYICSLCERDVPECAVFRHIADEHRLPAIAVVIRHHVGEAGLLDRFDQFPAFLERHCGDDFRKNVLTRFECLYRLACVKRHRCRNKHGIDARVI